MANPQIVAYIEQNSPTFPKEAIIQSLINAGWQPVDVAAAFAEVEHEVFIPPVIPPPATKATVPLPNPGADFVAQMQQRRKEAEEKQPLQNITVGNVKKSVVEQPSITEKGITGMLIRSGLVKNTRQANILLVATMLAGLALIAWLVWFK